MDVCTFIKIEKKTHILKRTINFSERESKIAKNKILKFQYLVLALTEPKLQKDLNLTTWTKICLPPPKICDILKKCYSKKSNWN